MLKKQWVGLLLIGLLEAVRTFGVDFYVSPQGLDTNPGTIDSPFKTIEKARDAVGTVNGNMTGDINVYLRGGWHTLTAPLTFDQTGSGTNGYNVIYQAYPGERPVVSGGRKITDWSLYDAGKNIWRAGAPGINTRQLYVNCVRAIRAHRGGALPGAVKTATGFTTTDAGMQSWGNQGDIELVFDGHHGGIRYMYADDRGWRHQRFGVASISGNAITTKTPPHEQLVIPTDVENAYELLDQPGEWYLDRTQGMLFYIPKSGEDLSTATVIAPVLENLISGAGILGTPLHNLQFKGITLAHATWLGPNGVDGFEEQQANVYGVNQIPLANVSFQAAQAIRFERCIFKHLGGVGLRLHNGSQNCMVTGCVFTDISANCVMIGHVTDPARSEPLARDDGNQITNCYIHGSPAEYFGGCGIMAGYVSNTLVSHNELGDLPYSGISCGWGWGTDSYAANNQFTYNYIHDFPQVLTDVGGIYTLSSQPNTKWNNNRVDNMGYSRYGGGMYCDNGSASMEIDHNVCSNMAGQWFQVTDAQVTGYPYRSHDMYVHDNYANTASMYLANGVTIPNSSIAAPTIISGAVSNWPAAAQGIASNAGLEAPYRDIKDLPCACSLQDDETKPALAQVLATSATRVSVIFSEGINKAIAEVTANYSLTPGISITGAALGTDNRTVTLTTSSLAEGITYTLTVSNIEDFAGNVIEANSQETFQYSGVKASLLGWWQFEETSGATAVDSSGKGNTGTLLNGVVRDSGRTGKGITLDGSDDYVSCGTGPFLNFSANAAFTLTGWVKTTEDYGTIISQRHSGSEGAILDITVGYDGAVTDAGKLMALVRQDNGGTGYARVTGGAVNDGAWHHFALTRTTGGSIGLFLDGVSQGTNSGSESGGAITTDLRSVGSERRWVLDSYGTADQRYLNGSVDDIQIYNYALSGTEIQSLYNNSSKIKVPAVRMNRRQGLLPPNPITRTALVKLAEESGLEIYDLSGNPVDLNLPLEPGIYIINSNRQAVIKTMVAM